MQHRPDPTTPRRGDALVVVDVQNDFLPGGALGIRGGDEILPALNRCLGHFHRLGLPVFATRDWHPPDHCSFAPQGGPWPVHCVAGTPGAEFAPGLRLPPDTGVIDKATRPEREAYSTLEGTDLGRRLRTAGVGRLFIGGLATDYCVLNTVRDAVRIGFAVVVLSDAIRAVDVEPGDGARAIAEMQQLGAHFIEVDRVTSEAGAS
jgi:nicotinamidase/pyrazinamidase